MTVRMALYRCRTCNWEGIIDELVKGSLKTGGLCCPQCKDLDGFQQVAEAEADISYT